VIAVILDMDGLVLDTEPISLRAWQRASAEYGWQCSESIYCGMVGLGREECREYLRRHIHAEGVIEAITKTANAYYLAEIDRDGIRCKRGLFRLLDFLEATEIPTAVATSTETTVALRQLDQTGIASRFNVVVGGDCISKGKPSPDIFLLAAARLGRVSGQCVVLEDAAPGIKAAVAAGMTAILVPDLCVPDGEIQRLAFTIVASLDEAIPVIQHLNTRIP
jgi:beta-phosphoglucomutase-like phosphatase (HAD superfamily)